MKYTTLALALVLLTASLTHACNCVLDPRPDSVKIQEAKDRGHAIFYGHVVDVKGKGTDLLTITLKVNKAWTSDLPSYVRVTTYPSEAGCGNPLTINRDYIVVASKAKDGLSIGLCGPTGLTRDGFPAEYKTALGPEYVAPTFPEKPVHKPSGKPDFAALWWKYGITVWLITFGFLKLRRFRKQHP